MFSTFLWHIQKINKKKDRVPGIKRKFETDLPIYLMNVKCDYNAIAKFAMLFQYF